MPDWKYSMGTWHEATEPIPWDEDADWDKGMKKAGYHSLFDIEGDLDVWGQEGCEPPFVVFFTLDLGNFKVVYIDDLPSLMMFLREYAPLFALQNTVFHLGEMREAGVKAFRAWHGHDPEGACFDCDPLVAQMQTERRAQMRAEREKLEGTK